MPPHHRSIGIDVGPTHCKAGLFAADGKALRIARRPTPTRRAPARLLIYRRLFEQGFEPVGAWLGDIYRREYT